jgi:hypothetical protein
MYLLPSLTIGLLVGSWIYQDARKRKIDDPKIWIPIGVLLGVFALIIYYFLHIRTKK